MAKLQSTYESSSEIPTGYEKAYEEKDGKQIFVGGEVEFKTETEFNELNAKKKSAFDELHEAKNKLKDYDGIDPKKHKELTDEVEVLRAKAKDGTDEETIKAIVDSRVARQTEELTTRNKTLETENANLLNFKTSVQKSNEVNKVLSKHVSKDVMEDAKFIINSAISKEADGSYMSNGENGFDKGLTVEQLVLKSLESRPHWKKKSTEGHGADGSDGNGGISKAQEFKKLYDKQIKEGLEPAEKQRFNQLALEMKKAKQGA